MARVRNIPASELPPATRDVYERYASAYGPFANQVAVFAHVPPAVDHLMPMLMEPPRPCRGDASRSRSSSSRRSMPATTASRTTSRCWSSRA